MLGASLVQYLRDHAGYLASKLSRLNHAAADGAVPDQRIVHHHAWEPFVEFKNLHECRHVFVMAISVVVRWKEEDHTFVRKGVQAVLNLILRHKRMNPLEVKLGELSLAVGQNLLARFL